MANQRPRKARVTKQRDVHTYAILWSASRRLLEAGESEETGSSWQFLSSLMLTAFSLEAFLNHVGPKVLSSWENLERLRPLEKLELLCEVLGIQLPGDGGQRPQQTIIELLRFRNTLAHGKTHSVASDEHIDVGEVDDHFKRRLLTHWERQVRDNRFARQAREDVERVMQIVNAATPEPEVRLFSSGFEIGSATVNDEMP